MKHYSFTQIVDKVCLYTGTSSTDSKYKGLTSLAKIIEENRLEIHKHIHNMRSELNHISDSINGNLGKSVDSYGCFDYWNSRVGIEANGLESAVNLANRTMDYLFPLIKDMLQPVWKVYWSEGCNTLSDVVLWLERADLDGGKKVQEFLSQK